MGWRERDYAKFTDAERKALYGTPAREPEPFRYYSPSPQRRSFLAPGATVAVIATVGVLLLNHGFHLGSAATLTPAHHTFPLTLSPTETYGSTLTINGTDPGANGGTVVARGQWNSGTWTTLGTAVLASDHSWSVPLSMNEHGTLNIRISLPSGDSLAGSLTVP